MTIVEEIDKKSNRPHRSKNIVDALKYAFDLKETPQNIGEAVKAGLGTGGGGFMGMKPATVSVTVKSLPEGTTLEDLICQWWIEDENNNDFIAFVTNECWQFEGSSIEIPVIDEHNTRISFTGNGDNLRIVSNSIDVTGNAELVEGLIYVTGDCSIAFDLEWVD